MAQIAIRLNTIGDVIKFNQIAGNISGNMDIYSGDSHANAKSIMGIFSLNLGRVLTVQASSLSQETLRRKLIAFLA